MMCKDCKSWKFIRMGMGTCLNELSPNFKKQTHKSDTCVPKKPVIQDNTKPDIGNILIESGVPKDKIEDCLKWAFGDDYSVIRRSEMDNRWNERHSDLFRILGTDAIRESFIKIGKAYLEKKDGK